MAHHSRSFRPTTFALLASLLFGISTPLAKLMLGSVEPILMAGFLYLGGGLGMSIYYMAGKLMGRKSTEAKLTSKDMSWLILALLVGGVIAPVLLMLGLDATPASTASLLLNFESVGTVLIAWLMFREAIGKKVWAALVMVLAGTIFLTMDLKEGWGISLGAVAIIISCILWGLDNNLMRKISSKDPVAAVAFKGTVAGTITLVWAFLIGSRLPPLEDVMIVLGLGFLCYGISIVLYLRAMREIGAARTGVLFGIAPFFGVALGIVMFKDPIMPLFLLAFLLIGLGTLLIFSESHSHRHTHTASSHEHRHSHDDGHHDHHGKNIAPHSHYHHHEPVLHDHRHYPDNHHGHVH